MTSRFKSFSEEQEGKIKTLIQQKLRSHTKRASLALNSSADELQEEDPPAPSQFEPLKIQEALPQSVTFGKQNSERGSVTSRSTKVDQPQNKLKHSLS